MTKPQRVVVTLTLIGPILTRGGQSPAPGIDAPMARDGCGRFLLPFSLIKGKVVDALRDLRPGDADVADWLGKPSGDANRDYEPDRGRLRFGDFATEQMGTQKGATGDGVIERIAIDRGTGSVAKRMLAMLEAPFGYGEPVAFTGTVEFIADDAEAERIRVALDEALRWVPAYGALRTVGFGRTQSVTTTLVKVVESAASAPALVGAALALRLTLDRPLCLVGKKHSRNHFESLESIPGTVLKGATARLLLELSGTRSNAIDPTAPRGHFPKVWRHFEAIRFAEARPMESDATRRPVEPPLSLVVVPDGLNDFEDVALLVEAKLFPTKSGPPAAPAFMPDWKDTEFASVRQAFGWPLLPRERRTRTAIDADTGRAADQELFSYGLVLPKRGEKSFVWETVIGLERLPLGERVAVAGELANLFAYGLPNVGKTRAVAAVEWLPKRTDPQVGGVTPVAGRYTVTLQTDCLMTDPTILGDDPEKLHAAYDDFWAEASGGALKLSHFFARQSLHGGYLSKRFGAKRAYEPYLVTDRGSVFVLETLDIDNVAACLDAWRDGALPVPKWVEVRYGRPGEPLWKTCPFLPHVGFGEVAVDLACPTKARP